MNHLAFLIDQGWNVGFYTDQINNDQGIITRVFWRAKYREVEYKSRKGFAAAEDALKDFIANADAQTGLTVE